MKIFKELKKLGYKHYTEHTIEELDNLPLNYEERIMEQALVLRWFREKYGWTIKINKIVKDTWSFSLENFTIERELFGGRFSSYEEAELECLKKLIEIVKQQ
jgi:hypothetical protein